MKKYVRFIPVLMAALLLVACGKSISGTYENANVTIKFEPAGKAYMTNKWVGMTFPVGYKLEGDKVLLQNPEGTITVLTPNEDGSYSGLPGDGGDLKKKGS